MKFNFWKTFGTNLLAVIIAGIILLFIFFGWIGYLMGSFDGWLDYDPRKPDLESKTVLRLKMQGPIAETSGVEFSSMSPLSTMSRTGVHDLILGIEEAKYNNEIEGILLDLGMINTGWATTSEIREALTDFKSSGKFLYAYSEVLNQKGYYLASVADSIFLNPTGIMAITGLSANVTFVQGLLEKTDLDVQIIRGSNNQFKSAVEPLMRKDMSEASKLQTRKYLGALWERYLVDISESRGVDKNTIKLIADSLLVRNPKDALVYGLIDRIVYRDEVEHSIRKAIDLNPEDDIEFYDGEKYARRFAEYQRDDWEDNDPNIAIIYAEGSISQGKSEVGDIGSDTYAKAIKKARKDDDIKAIVLRVNSPGGDVIASDIMWRELVLASKEKPLIVSMGDVAASGGYYISIPADKIFARENSITGSIGVFMVWPNTKGMFNKHLGITFDTVKTNPYGDFMSITRPLTDYEKEVFQDGVDETYLDFLSKVEEARPVFESTQDVDSIAQGRVWSGTDARQIGLIDEFGGISDAVTYAADQADIDRDDVKILTLPERETSKFLSVLRAIEQADEEENDEVTAQSTPETEIERELLRQWHMVRDLGKLSGYQARMLWNIRVD